MRLHGSRRPRPALTEVSSSPLIRRLTSRSCILLRPTGRHGQQESGDNPAIALLTVLGDNPPASVVINEMTTVASVWTNAQFLDGAAIKGHALGLRIAAGNVPNFVDLQTGGWGEAIQDPLNSGQTPTMANFATLADVLAGCATRVTADACDKLLRRPRRRRATRRPTR